MLATACELRDMALAKDKSKTEESRAGKEKKVKIDRQGEEVMSDVLYYHYNYYHYFL
jgi:hypothetical protein